MSQEMSESDFQEKLDKLFDEAEQPDPACPFCNKPMDIMTVFHEMELGEMGLVAVNNWVCHSCDIIFQ